MRYSSELAAVDAMTSRSIFCSILSWTCLGQVDISDLNPDNFGPEVPMAVLSTEGGIRGRQAGQSLEGSFSAVPKPVFASNHYFCSISFFLDLKDWHLFALLQLKKSAIIVTICTIGILINLFEICIK